MSTACSADGAPAYAELHCASNFSFLRGASHPAELVERAHQLGYRALALTDECSLAGVVRAHQAAREHGLALIVGSELRLTDGPRLVLLAADRDGYGNLAELITRARRRAPKGRYRLERADLRGGLPGCLALLIPDDDLSQGALAGAAGWLAQAFPDAAWIAVELLCAGDDTARLAALQALSARTGVPLVAAGDVHMHRRARRALQDLVTAIRLGTTVEQAGWALFPNGERHLRSRRVLARRYPAALLAETLAVAARCRFSLDELRYEYPDDLVPPGVSPGEHLRRLTEDGMRTRWPEGTPAAVRALVERELALIGELRYAPYFLTVHDIVRFARGRGILCQGRGSAANSAVCYCLGITAIDPSRAEMLFERFVSRERDEPPDIDVDFEHQRREQVMQYVYARYGRERAALAATVIRYRTRSALRDSGKALGLDADTVERLARALGGWSERPAAERLRSAGLDPGEPLLKRVLALAGALRGFPRHLSQHVGGFVIARDRVSRLVPVENAAMPERTVIQWDKDDLDAVGLLKVDCLALGILTAIRRAFELIQRYRGAPALTLATIPAEDPATYAMIRRADTVGVFQIESRAQMGMLPRLKPACSYDLVIQVAIIRPGPIQGGMVHPYLRRRRGAEPVRYPSEAVRAVLERTLGVPLFQEQVIKLAMVAAGFSAGEADRLRRSMAAWNRSGDIQRFRQRLIDGLRRHGYPAPFVAELLGQIEGFGAYGFPESHAASFALLAYASAWLKCHEPAAFCCALLNSQPLGFYAPAQLVADARRHGVAVRPVSVSASDWDCTLERGPRGEPALRLGLRLVKGLTKAGAERLVAGGRRAFGTVAELIERTALDRRDRRALAAAGALTPLAGDRGQSAWQAAGASRQTALTLPAPGEPAPLLPPATLGQALVADYASTGVSLGPHPLTLLRARLARAGALPIAALRDRAADQAAATAGLVLNRQRPGSARGVVFLTLEDETGMVNVIVPPWLLARREAAVLGAGLLEVRGRIERDGEVVQLLARALHDRSAWLGALRLRSRDFR